MRRWLRLGAAAGVLAAALASATCQPRFQGTRLVSSRAETDGVRLGDIPVRLIADERSQRALDALTRETALRHLALRHSDSATTRVELVTRGVHGEGYRIEVTREKILLEGEGPEGTFYAAQDLLQRMQSYGEGRVIVPFMAILEQPFFAYRAMHLDVARHYFPPADVERLIDVFASMRINTLHLHLSDDQGFSLELPQAKELATRSADGRLRAYTKDQIAELVAFAASRFVTLVPELDVPGHTRSWLVGHPELACPLGEKSFTLADKGGIYPEVLCAGNPDVRNYVKARLAELAELFPGKYLHMGGDEVPPDRWKKCPKCKRRGQWLRAEAADRARAKDKAKSKNALEEEAKKVPIEKRLYADFVADIAQSIDRHGKVSIGWDETAAVDDGPQILQLWQDERRASELMALGKPMILSPLARTYFNQKNAESQVGPGEGGPLGWREVAEIDWRPLARAGRAGQIMGGSGALWTEHVETMAEAEQLYFPRAMILAEVLWRGHFRPGSGTAGEQWLAAHFERLALFGVQFYLSPPEELMQRSVALQAGNLSFRAPRDLPGAVVRLRLDDGDITDADPTSIVVSEGANKVRAATFWKGRRSEIASGTLVVEGLHPAIPVTSEAPSGCTASVLFGRYEKVADSYPAGGRRYEPCDAIGMLGGKPGSVRALGAFHVEAPGVVRVELRADDGAKLWIDGVLVVDHDGVHAASRRRGEIALAAGRHEYELRYADVGGQALLDVQLHGAVANREKVSLFEISETR